jgi:SAM-dependent methyltransferase
MNDAIVDLKNLTSIGMGIDQHAVLYRYNNKILRAINSRYKDFYAGLANSSEIKYLIESNILIQTGRSPLKLEGYDLVLEHPVLPFVSYPFEWTPSMFKDAAMTILKLNIHLMKQGLCTHDAHLWNVLFDGTTPKFIDFTSIIKVPPDQRWRAFQGFKYFCLNPLLLMSKGHATTARALMREIFFYPDPAFVEEVTGTKLKKPPSGKSLDVITLLRNLLDPLPFSIGEKARDVLHTFRKVKSKIDSVRINGVHEIEILLGKLEKLDVKPKQSKWSNYYAGRNELPIYDGSLEGLNAIKGATPKHALIERLLLEIKPETLLDLGCNRGLYSQLAALNGARVIGIDTDEYALDQMYNDSKAMGTNVLPLYVNAVAPAEAIGFKEIPFPSVTDRLKADCVLCLALVHHLVFKKTHMSFEHIAKVLSSYSNKYLIVEFIPKEDKHLKNWYIDNFNWYSSENLKKALYKHFSMIKVFESFPSPRIILFCSKE